MSKPVIYYYFLSPPSRAVKIFVDAAGIDAEVKTISILKGEHRGEAYLAVNSTGKLPFLKVRRASLSISCLLVGSCQGVEINGR